MRRLLLFCLLAPMAALAQAPLPPVGTWREHLPYGSALDVTASDNRVFCATPYSLFSIHLATRGVERMSKISGLSETGIAAIRFDGASGQLVVAYTNSNIDVIGSNSLKNIPDLKRKNTGGDKSIYHIYPFNRFCYLSTGLGVVVLDLQKYEIADSWLIGRSGGFVKVQMFTRDNSFFYAATDEGLKKTAVGNINPADFRSWQVVSGTEGLAAAACKGVVNLDNRVIAWQNDSLFVQEGMAWKPFFTSDWPIVSINAEAGSLVVCQRKPGGESRVLHLSREGAVLRTLQQPGIISFPKNGIVKGGALWVADLYGALSHWTGGTFEHYKLNSPEEIATGELVVENNTLYAAAGAVNDAWNYQYNGNGIYRFSEGTWTNFNRFHFPQLDSLLDFVTVAIDPRDNTAWAGSFGGGLLHIRAPGQFQVYKQASPIGPTLGDPTSYRVAGLAFDRDNNLWVANFGAARYLHVLKNDGTWRSFHSPFSLFLNAVAQIVVDDGGQKWIVSPLNNGLLCFNHGASIDNPADDQWKLYRSGTGNGNLPSSSVLSIARDKSGFIWVGTSDGIGIIQCPEAVFTTGCEALLPVISDGSFAGYLFKGEEVRSIAVDGADRKWIATQNGAWLISAEGDKVLAHFTEEKSPLLSNDVKKVAIDGRTGEVFFATAKGICSFRGTATAAAGENESLLVFPNPVPPQYTGTISIRGLPENGYVKITELNGRLVYQARALGGQAVWDGRDYKGRRIATGIYLVLVTDEAKQQSKTGKIVFISK